MLHGQLYLGEMVPRFINKASEAPVCAFSLAFMLLVVASLT